MSVFYKTLLAALLYFISLMFSFFLCVFTHKAHFNFIVDKIYLMFYLKEEHFVSLCYFEGTVHMRRHCVCQNEYSNAASLNCFQNDVSNNLVLNESCT